MYENIEENVQVGAVFKGSAVKPKWFLWNEKRYVVKEVTCTWQSYEGEARLVNFSVSDGNCLYELCFNQSSLKWKLLRVWLD